MKIALLSEKYTPDIGGLAISAERLARLLCSAGHRMHVFAPSTSLAPGERWMSSINEVCITRFGARKRLDDTLVDWFELLVEEHRREPFDVIHAYFLTQAGFTGAYAGNYLGVPSVVSARGNDLDRAVFDPAKAAHILYALQHAGAVTTNATALAKKAAALVPALDVTVIPNGVDPDHFRPLQRNMALAKSLGILKQESTGPAGPVIGFAGELREKKGLRTILSACAQIITKHPATLLIVGDVRVGDDRQILEEFRQAHPEARVVVTGFVPHGDLPAYYALMDVFVQPSLRDGLPNALLEAMACERAVVCTPVGGIQDAVQDGANGRLVRVNQASELAAAIDDLLNDAESRSHLGRDARQTVMEKFTARAELEGNLAVYRRLGLQP